MIRYLDSRYAALVLKPLELALNTRLKLERVDKDCFLQPLVAGHRSARAPINHHHLR